jgi:SepF-like predicted cell division protein (DUF552 family)
MIDKLKNIFKTKTAEKEWEDDVRKKFLERMNKRKEENAKKT